MLDAIMEYISTHNIPHVFLEDNVKITNNTIKTLAQRPENNELHKLDLLIILFYKTLIIVTVYRFSKVITKHNSGIQQLPIPSCIKIDLAKTVVLNITATRLAFKLMLRVINL